MNSSHTKESYHTEIKIDSNKIIKDKNNFLEKKDYTINEVKSGKCKYYIYDNDLNSMNN